MAKSKSRHTPTANPAMAHAMRELRRSNAAVPHVLARRKGARSERRRQAIKDSENHNE